MSIYQSERKQLCKRGESSHRTMNTFSARISAYDRIFSAKNVLTGMLPNFMAEAKAKEGLTKLDLLRFNLKQKPKPEKIIPVMEINDSSINLKVNENPNDRLKINSNKLQDIKKIKKIIDDIFNPTLPVNEIVLTFNKRRLTRENLICIREGELPDCIVDCYMSILKIANKLTLKKVPTERVLIINSMYSKQLFQIRREIPIPKTDIFEYDIMLFPIFNEYWTLMSVNLLTGVVNYYDGLMPEKDITVLLSILRRFIAQANFNNNPKVTDNFLEYKQTSIVPITMNLKDSGIYICKIAERITQHREIKEFEIRTLRKDMLVNLIKISMKIAWVINITNN